MPGDFVLPTVSVSLRSEAMAVQHHAFKKRSALCSSSLSAAFLPADTSECDYRTAVSDIECVTLTWVLNCPATPDCLGSNLHPGDGGDYLQHSLQSTFLQNAWGTCATLGAWCMLFIPWGDAIPPRKASLSIHWCALDWEISGANCFARKCRRQCSAMLSKRDMHARTNSDSHNHKTHQHACKRANYFRSRCWGETVDLKRGNKKDYSLRRAAAAAALGDKASIHLGLNLRHSEEK